MSTSADVVVGIDGSDQALGAALWAADHADRTGSSLRLVTVAHTLSGPVEVSTDLLEDNKRWQAEHLQRARTRVLRDYPGLSVSTALLHGDTLRALVNESENATAVVIGSRGTGGFSGLLLGSTSLRLTAKAKSPVIVVPSTVQQGQGIVVGDDGSEHADLLRAFAFDQARARQCGLHVVRVVANAYWYGPQGPYGEWLRAAIRRTEDALAADVAPWRQDYAEVDLTTSVQWGHPADVLRNQAEGRELLVVGTHGRGWATSLLLGSISHNVLHHAPSPVAVLGPRDV